jgi:hypothetical protein
MAPQASIRTFDAKYLTEALRRSDVLQDGRVTEVVVLNARPTLVSRIERLQLSYDGPAGNAPTSVILKTGLPERLGGDLVE